jgi:hypothetical protein
LSSSGGSGEVRGGQPDLGSRARGSGTGRVVNRWAECRGSGGNHAAGAGGFRRPGLYFQWVRFAQPAGQHHRYPAQGKRRRLRCAHRDVESCFLRPCPHGRGPAEARHGTERHGECGQRRQDIHHDCRAEVTGPAPSQHRKPDLAVPAPGLGQRSGRGHHHLPRTADPQSSARPAPWARKATSATAQRAFIPSSASSRGRSLWW